MEKQQTPRRAGFWLLYVEGLWTAPSNRLQTPQTLERFILLLGVVELRFVADHSVRWDVVPLWD